MFKKKSTEQQIIVEAERISSMKESLDALSWSRVGEIAKDLQDGVSDEERYEYGRELLAIAQANTSLLGKLGISTDSLSGQLMPSGIEMLQEGESIESFEPEEPEVFVEPDKETLDDEKTGKAKEAALSFLYEEKPSADLDVPEVVEDTSDAKTEIMDAAVPSPTELVEQVEPGEAEVVEAADAAETQVLEPVETPEPKLIPDTDRMEPVGVAKEDVDSSGHPPKQKMSRKQKKKQKRKEIEGYIRIDEPEVDN